MGQERLPTDMTFGKLLQKPTMDNEHIDPSGSKDRGELD